MLDTWHKLQCGKSPDPPITGATHAQVQLQNDTDHNRTLSSIADISNEASLIDGDMAALCDVQDTASSMHVRGQCRSYWWVLASWGLPASAQRPDEPSQSVHHLHQCQSHWRFPLHHPCSSSSGMQLVQGRSGRCGERWCSLGHCHLVLLPLALCTKAQSAYACKLC